MTRTPGYAEHIDRELRRIFEGKRIIVVGGPVAGLTGLARQLVALGAERPFIIGSSMGLGAPPEPEEADWCSLELSAKSVNDSMRGYERHLLHPPDEVRARVDAWDPERKAIALGAIVLGELPTVCGRPRFGARPRDWIALEDKTRIDELWDALGVRRAPSEIVRASRPELLAAAARLDRGDGTVWVADARDGVHGGAEKLYRVQQPTDADDALELLSAEVDRVRVMPFLEGIPCSIHGIVTPEGVAVFRPVELVTLRRPNSGRFVYSGAATYWDPPLADRETMRQVGRVVGEGLAKRIGFRGGYTVDGVMTREGFLPTELNPRVGAGLGVLGQSLPSVPVTLLAVAAQAGQDLDYRTAVLEAELVHAADESRRGGAWTVVTRSLEQRPELLLAADGDGYRVAGDRDDIAGRINVGPSDVGGFVRFSPSPDHTPVGQSIAPRAVAAFAIADRELGTGLGTLTPARSVR